MFNNFKQGEEVRMVWKHFFCGGSNKGVVVGSHQKPPRIVVRLNSGDHVIHNAESSEFCEIVKESDWGMFRRSFGFGK